MPSLGNEYLLIYLCIHGCKHIWQRLEWICCLNELIGGRDIDWDLVLDLAQQWSARRMLAIGVLITECLFDTPVPEATLQVLQKEPGSGLEL